MEFIYARYRTFERASMALESMYAAGEVFPCEVVGIRKRGGAWAIIIRGE